ncbi:hypothetical protein [Hymenobacter cellulosivorans]|uniref:HNH endonuclease n=1 Tax=Hymenobacter cellulosivorans TaxID=2932249 RepID=A0ABY4FDX0_9BACT|nr:hypothetical protein [Hymenobacter cellulosivorans]UOQ54784.1 hypothetical protein MUN80_08490 [Hymenobacter cellulosivorans]
MYAAQLCIECYSKNNVKGIPDLTIDEALSLPEAEQLILEDRIYAVYNAINRKSICAKCFSQVQVIDAKRTGKNLPFEPFENTLMYKDSNILNELKTQLNENFHFTKITNPATGQSESTWGVFSGDITKPLSIYFYYIAKREEQDRILNFIDRFFENITQKQRKVTFYEAKNWIVEERPNGTSVTKGEEKVLLEVLVK